MDFFALALIFLTILTTAGAINFIVTILRLRGPGMAIRRMRLFLYSTLTLSVTILFALPFMDGRLHLPRTGPPLGNSLFRRRAGLANHCKPFLRQQLFWFFGHPWVYVIFLPATGP
jgi:cytochrome c oxidase subunit 1/cytochrome c oxidase subunit I+III